MNQKSWSNLSRWHLDIDRYLFSSLPAFPWHKLPYPVARMLGYRKEEPAFVGNIVVALWSLLGVFCSIAVVTVVTIHVPYFESHHAPTIIASFVSDNALAYQLVTNTYAFFFFFFFLLPIYRELQRSCNFVPLSPR